MRVRRHDHTGYLPTGRHASLYVEVAPGNEGFRLVVLRSNPRKPSRARRSSRREFGSLKSTSRNQAAKAGSRAHFGSPRTQYCRTHQAFIASVQIIPTSTLSGAIVNRFRRGSMLVPGETMWCSNARQQLYQMPATKQKKARISRSCISSVVVWAHVALRFGGRNPDCTQRGGGKSAEGVEGRRKDSLPQETRDAESSNNSVSPCLSGIIEDVLMAKIFYTERDIDDLKARGVDGIDVTDNVVMTGLAVERAMKHWNEDHRRELSSPQASYSPSVISTRRIQRAPVRAPSDSEQKQKNQIGRYWPDSTVRSMSDVGWLYYAGTGWMK